MIKSKSSRHIINVQHQSLYLLVYICWEIYSHLITNRGFRGGSDGKESACNAGDPGLITGLGISPREGKGYPFQYSDLENSVDRGTWLATVHGVARSPTQLRDKHFHFHNKQDIKEPIPTHLWNPIIYLILSFVFLNYPYQIYLMKSLNKLSSISHYSVTLC